MKMIARCSLMLMLPLLAVTLFAAIPYSGTDGEAYAYSVSNDAVYCSGPCCAADGTLLFGWPLVRTIVEIKEDNVPHVYSKHASYGSVLSCHDYTEWDVYGTAWVYPWYEPSSRVTHRRILIDELWWGTHYTWSGDPIHVNEGRKEYWTWDIPVSIRRDALLTTDIPTGTVIDGRTAVQLFAPNDNIIIYYTIDGSEPGIDNAQSKVYSQKIGVKDKTIIKAVGYYDGVLSTQTLVAQYGTGKTATPTSSQGVGCQFFDQGFEIRLMCETDGVKIHYTTDGSVPTERSPI